MIPNDVKESHAAFAALQETWRKMARPIKVLLVEDNLSDVEETKRVIATGRVEMKIAYTGSEAKQWLDQQEYDLCLLDLKLSDMDGTDILKWLKERDKNVPVVVLSGMSDGSPQISEALTLGAQAAFQKPLTADNAKMILGATK